jgi:hypothetical protein
MNAATKLDILDREKAQRLLWEHLSPRYRELDKLEAYVERRQYEGRPPFNKACDVPVKERAPSINYPIVEMAIESNADLILGEGRWPVITTFPGEDDSEIDPEFGLNEADSEVIDALILKVVKQSRFVALITQALSAAQGCGTVAVVFGVRRGKLIGETVRAKWCAPTFSEDDPNELTALEIRYPFIKTEFDSSVNRWRAKCYWYRRTIDAEWDRHYRQAEAPEDGTEPKWVEDKMRSRRHALGFCPARWYAFMRDIDTVDQIDGHAIHEGSFDIVDSLNFALSQKDRAAFYSGDPQMVETGVDENEEPAEKGRPAQMNGDGYSANRRQQGATRKRGAATIWTYRSPEAKVEYLTLGADALNALADNGRDLRAKLQEALKVVVLDPEHAKHAAEFSNKALRTLLKRQLGRCDKIREDLGGNLLIPAIGMLLRIAYVVNKRKPGSVYLPGLKRAMPILERFEREVESDVDDAADPVEGEVRPDTPSTVAWFDPHIDLKWGPYFEPDPQEENQIVQGVVQAYTGRVITRKTAVGRMPASYGINNPDQYVEAIAEEEHEQQEHQLELTHAMNKLVAGNGPDEDKAPDEGGGGGKPPGRAKAEAED